MHRVKFLVVIGIGFLSLSVCLTVSPSSADIRDLGDVCIIFSFSNSGFPPLAHRFGLLVYGANQQHMLLTAAIGASAAHGSAILSGDTVIATFTESHVSGDFAATSTTHLVLSASTLSGTFTTMTVQVAPSSVSTKVTGTAAVIPCS